MTTSLELQHFAVLNIAYLHFTDAVLIIITTNNPCHLTCYYSEEPPGRHKTSRTQRGLTLPWGAYFCFVAWKSVEQMEPGDTLSHTFIIPDWLLNSTLWFAFRGTVATVLSPSVSCLFQHEHTGQNLILNPGFEDWTAPPGNAPDHWAYPPAPHFGYDWPDTTFKTEGDYSVRTDNPTPWGNFYLWQELDFSFLDNLHLTFTMDYRGKNHFLNSTMVYAKGDTTQITTSRPTLDYQWETISCHIHLPNNLTRLYIRAQNWNQNFPLPFQTWRDKCEVYYAP